MKRALEHVVVFAVAGGILVGLVAWGYWMRRAEAQP